MGSSISFKTPLRWNMENKRSFRTTRRRPVGDILKAECMTRGMDQRLPLDRVISTLSKAGRKSVKNTRHILRPLTLRQLSNVRGSRSWVHMPQSVLIDHRSWMPVHCVVSVKGSTVNQVCSYCRPWCIDLNKQWHELCHTIQWDTLLRMMSLLRCQLHSANAAPIDFNCFILL